MTLSLALVRTASTSVRTGIAIRTNTTAATRTAGSSSPIGPIALARTSWSAGASAIDSDELRGAPLLRQLAAPYSIRSDSSFLDAAEAYSTAAVVDDLAAALVCTSASETASAVDVDIARGASAAL